jgi:hypothetical protein
MQHHCKRLPTRLECVLHYVHPQQLVQKAHEVDKAPAGSCRVCGQQALAAVADAVAGGQGQGRPS